MCSSSSFNIIPLPLTRVAGRTWPDPAHLAAYRAPDATMRLAARVFLQLIAKQPNFAH